MASSPMSIFLQKQNVQLQNNLDRLNNQFNQEKAAVDALEKRLTSGQVTNDGARSLAHNLGSVLDPYTMPGNVGDINRIVWPFWFRSSDTILQPNQSSVGNITITQEAGFILLYYTQTVFMEIAGLDGVYSYVDPNAAGSASKAPGLKFSFMDSSSQRTFMNREMSINQVGYWKNPTTLPQPIFFLPNSNIRVNFVNNSANTYRPRINFFGYRFRLDHAQEVLSLVHA